MQVISPPQQRVTAHVINPPHLKSQPPIVQSSSSPVIKNIPNSVRIRTVNSKPSTPVAPQGVQSFRIIRAQTSAQPIISNQGPHIFTSQSRPLINQHTTRQLVRPQFQASPQVKELYFVERKDKQ